MSNCYECDTPLTTICPQCNPYLSAAPARAEDEVERVARRICRETHEPITQEKHAVMALDLALNMDGYRRLARAAISTMRPAPKLTEEDRARMKTVAEEIRGYAGHDAPWLAKRSEELLSLIDKLTEAG